MADAKYASGAPAGSPLYLRDEELKQGVELLSVADLLAILKVTKQSLNRVLNDLLDGGYVERKAGMRDRRTRQLKLTAKGTALEEQIWEARRPRLVRAFREAGPDAVMGFRRVLMSLVEESKPQSS